MRRSISFVWLSLALAAPLGAQEETPPPPETVATPAPAETQDAARRMRLDAVRDDLVALRFEKALAAIGGFLGEPELTEAIRAEALVLRAQAHVAIGDLNAAEEDYEAILALRPGYKPDASLVTPKAMQRFEKVQKRMIGLLLLELTPADARVRLDGRAVSLRPDGSLPVLVGRHELELTRDGYDPLVRDVVVEANEISPMEIELIPNARTVIVRTDQPGIEVWLDGTPVGTTDFPDDPAARPIPWLVLPNLPLGEHRYEFRRDCYRTHVVREILNIDLIQRGPREIETVVLEPTRAVLIVRGGPAGAEVSVDGEPVGRLPMDPVETCPATRQVDVTWNQRPLWRSNEQFIDASTVELTIVARPNVGVLGADELPHDLRVLGARFNVIPLEGTADHVDWSREDSWKSLQLPRWVDLAVAIVPPSRPGAAEQRTLYSPVLNVIHDLDRLPPSVEPPRWTRSVWGMRPADGPAGPVVVQLAPDGAAAQAGLSVGDRIVSVDGDEVARAAGLAARLDAAQEPLDVVWATREGEQREGTIRPQTSPWLRAADGDPLEAAFRAAWAVVGSMEGGEQAVALSNLAALFAEFDLSDLAVETWSRVSWGPREGVGDGTVQYYLGRELERLGREEEAAAAYRKAATSTATAFHDEGPAVAPAALDRLTDLGVSLEE